MAPDVAMYCAAMQAVARSGAADARARVGALRARMAAAGIADNEVVRKVRPSLSLQPRPGVLAWSGLVRRKRRWRGGCSWAVRFHCFVFTSEGPC